VGGERDSAKNLAPNISTVGPVSPRVDEMERPQVTWTATADHKRFIKRYAQALESGDVAVFAGAGLSRGAGYVDWKSLLKEIANDLKLDIDRETDLIAVAQYHLNEKRSRTRITQTIVDELAGTAKPTPSHAVIARLPVATVWTTNYDQLLEHAFENAGKLVDVKIVQENLAHTKRGRDVVLYKMHGCVTYPHETVITKDDYEQYERKRPLFVEALKGDLVSKTFLFLGFSFADPNIDYILSRVRVLLGTNVREHYCVMREPEQPPRLAGTLKAEYDYEKRRTALRQSDLLRFGIDTVWVEDFSHVKPLLEALSSHVHRNSVFVSGACSDPSPLDRDRLDGLTREIGSRLIRDGYNLVSGFGLGLGEQCVLGALRALYGIPKGAEVERLVVRPFPRAKDGDQQAQNTFHREELIARSGIVVVVSGNRATSGSGTEISPGVLEEVGIALRQRKFVVPIGATGHAARKVWEMACARSDEYLPGIRARTELNVLGNSSATNDQLINALFAVLTKARKALTV
jgi:Sir2- and TIR-associating SLOG family/SIR2-like domain